MIIEKCRVYILESELPRPFAFSQDWVTKRCGVVVELVTSDGVSGWGEALCAGLQDPSIAASVIHGALSSVVLGRNPLDSEVIWDDMYHKTRDYGRKGAVIGGISAIDIALWDLKGKMLGVPVVDLLGGKYRHRVQAYATGFFREQGVGEAARLAEEAQGHVAAGFDRMKVKLGFGIRDDIEVMNAVRDGVGESVELMIDVNHAYSPNEAVRLGQALRDFDLRWFEEPVVPEDIEGYRWVRQKLDTPIAGGEAEFTAYGFRDLIERGAVDVAQPDIAMAGGFTACKQIATLASVHAVQVNPHVWGTAIGQYASLHLIAALPVATRSLFAQEPIFEYDTSSHPFRSNLVDVAVEHNGGWVEVPSGPGLGFEVDRGFLDAHATTTLEALHKPRV